MLTVVRRLLRSEDEAPAMQNAFISAFDAFTSQSGQSNLDVAAPHHGKRV